MATAAFKELMQKATVRAEGDEAFRTAFMSNPRSALESAYDIKLPAQLDDAGLQARVQSRFGIQSADGELSDTQLETVAGGLCFGEACGCF
jgi:hypothetical protein